MAKRIVTKIGDVFCVEVEGRYKAFFQYIANDMTQLNSSVIRVFKRKYPMDYDPIIEEIVKDKVMFHAHTVLKFGIQEGVWYKVGKSNELGLDELSRIYFAMFINDDEPVCEIMSLDWGIWHLGGNVTNIGKLSDEMRKQVEYGLVVPWPKVINRIKTGHYLSPKSF